MSPNNFFKWILSIVGSFLVVFIGAPLVIFLVVVVFSSIFSERPKSTPNRVAVVEMTGVITSSREVVEELYRVVEDEKVRAVVLRIDSPGGSVGPSQEVYNAVKKLKEIKPIVASMGSVAASGGLYSALGASKIYAMPGTLTGSIGVLLQIPNFKKIADLVGFQMITLTSGQLKDAGNPFKDMSDTDRNFLQGTINEAYKDFLKAVVESRNIPEAKARLFADGRMILGSQAVTFGLIDGVGDIYDAAKAALELAGVTLEAKESPDLFYPMDKYKYFRRFLESWNFVSDKFSTSMQLKYLSY